MYCAFELSIRLRYVYLKWNLLPCKGEINSPGVCMKKDIEMPAKMAEVEYAHTWVLVKISLLEKLVKH